LLLLLRLIFNKHPEIQKKTLRGARNKERERERKREKEIQTERKIGESERE